MLGRWPRAVKALSLSAGDLTPPTPLSAPERGELAGNSTAGRVKIESGPFSPSPRRKGGRGGEVFGGIPLTRLHVVTGATGLLGSHVVEQLVARGERVRAVVRGGSDTRFLHS